MQLITVCVYMIRSKQNCNSALPFEDASHIMKEEHKSTIRRTPTILSSLMRFCIPFAFACVAHNGKWTIIGKEVSDSKERILWSNNNAYDAT